MYGIQIVVIWGSEVPVPHFDLCLNECSLIYTSKTNQYYITVESQIQSSHYNNGLGMWEPFVEPFFFRVDHCFNDRGNPQQQTTVVFNPDKSTPLNVNITASMVLKLMNLAQVW